MRVGELLLLPGILAASVCASAQSGNDYSEHLHLKPLPGGALYAGFNFTGSTPVQAYETQHFRYFPRSLGQILQFTRTAELHLRFALGRWDEERWGSRPRDGKMEGGTGVELWAWLEADTQREAEERWNSLVNSLSGLFCASLNFIDQTKTTQPVLSFPPQGSIEGHRSRLQLMHGMLPNEVVCTENLTPFLKLLPCKGKAGISSLLDGHKVFDANWQTMAIDVTPICRNTSDCVLNIQQTVDLVLDIERSMRSRDDPIPRPPPLDNIHCDKDKSYDADDTCFPGKIDWQKGWSVSQIFGQSIQGSCPIGGTGTDVSIETSPSSHIEVTGATSISSEDGDPNIRQYCLTEGRAADLKMPRQPIDTGYRNANPVLYASRQITGYGQERGGMHTTLRNPLPHAQRVVFLESLPWFLRPYVHTISAQGATLEKMYYTPAVDRRRGTRLELLLNIPANATVDLTYDFEKAILRYTEYPPDANRGFDVAPAIIRVLPSANDPDAQDSYVRTTSLLLPLPTPDFSMPYNVIILSSTVIALGFGSILNLLIRRFILLEEVPPSPLNKLKVLVSKVKEAIAKAKGGKSEKLADESKGDGGGGLGGSTVQSTGAQHHEHSETAAKKRGKPNDQKLNGKKDSLGKAL